MSKPHAYAQLLEPISGPFNIFPAGTVRWAWINGQPVSPVITEYWLSESLIREIRPGVYVKASEHVEAKVCECCGQPIPSQEVANAN